jgi:cytidine deaminase
LSLAGALYSDAIPVVCQDERMAVETCNVNLVALQDAARRAKVACYPRYSGYPVLAAVERIDGAVYGGANIEVVNYTLTKHAEEAAVMAAIADGALELGDKWLSAVYTVDAPPCGSCRQFLWEWAAPDAACLIEEADERHGTIVHRFRLADLLPTPFDPSLLPDRRPRR